MKVTVKDTLKIYWRAVRNHLPSFFFAAAGIVGGSILYIIEPIYFKKFFDLLSSQQAPAILYPHLFGLLLTIMGLFFGSWICYRIAELGNTAFQTSVITDLKEHAFSALLHHSYTFFSNSFAGALVRRVHRLANDGFEMFADRMLWTLLPLVISLGGIVIVLWSTLPAFAVVLVIWFLIFFTVQIALSLWKMQYDIARGKRDTQNSAILADSLANHATIQLFARKKYEFLKFREANQDLRKIMFFTWNLGGVIDAVQSLLFMIIQFVVLYVALRAWRDGQITLGTFVLVQTYLVQIFGKLWDFGRAVRNIYSSFADAKEMVEIMLTPIDVADIPRAPLLSVTRGEIIFDHVSFSYQKTRRVLNDISLNIPSGQRIGLVGPSGAGKSTVVKLLLRLHDVESGHITIDGQDIQKCTQDSLRESVSFVPQEPILFHRTLMENIRYGRLDATDEEVHVAATRAHCDAFIRDLPDNYQTLVGERGVKLSGGERQRIAIARAILKNAPILVLDEATSSLDSESELLIQDALEKLMKGKTVIAIAHRLSTIRQMDRIIVLTDGCITEEGSHESLLKKRGSMYAKLWELQSGGFFDRE
ncbi:MAG: ABC transporter ATP-binding protein [Candidatus Uhrbacteria bacterium]|nr:ABC transporter ATP-binding protein [Candidatus Uhrbacteria bacterium]